MAHTPHGHHIDGSVLEERPENVARCGGPRMCIKCANAIAEYWKDEAGKSNPLPSLVSLQKLSVDQGTMFKVYDALKDSGMSQQQAVDAINQMQNHGIYFREAA